MHCHSGNNNRAPRWTFTNPCKPEVRPGAREESASPAWPAAPQWMPATQQKCIYWGLTLDVDRHYIGSVTATNTQGKMHNNTWVEPKNTNLVEDIEIMLPVQFRWFPFIGFRGEVENVSANQRPGRPSCISHGSEKYKLVEDVDILLLVKFRWIPFNGFRVIKNVSANQRLGGHLVFLIGPKNTNW